MVELYRFQPCAQCHPPNTLKNLNRHDAVVLGENLLQKALSSLLPKDILLSDDLKEKYLADLNTKQTSFEEVLYNVGMGHTLPVHVAMHIAELAGQHFGSEVKLSPIKVNDQETGRIHFAECCHPIPGDAIRALLVKDKGMIIHRDTCQTLVKADPEEQLDAGWDSLRNQTYRTILNVKSEECAWFVGLNGASDFQFRCGYRICRYANQSASRNGRFCRI